mmetsp:Transcript_14096/g.28489  ORF Transcript_14096/g.28489 Transcript_14096/m.28489 type:complete len:257 (+) Transcript_14096:251-1021(+)
MPCHAMPLEPSCMLDSLVLAKQAAERVERLGLRRLLDVLLLLARHGRAPLGCSASGGGFVALLLLLLLLHWFLRLFAPLDAEDAEETTDGIVRILRDVSLVDVRQPQVEPFSVVEFRQTEARERDGERVSWLVRVLILVGLALVDLLPLVQRVLSPAVLDLLRVEVFLQLLTPVFHVLEILGIGVLVSASREDLLLQTPLLVLFILAASARHDSTERTGGNDRAHTRGSPCGRHSNAGCRHPCSHDKRDHACSHAS